MLGIVRLALNRPYTFIVAALLIFLIGTLAALRMPPAEVVLHRRRRLSQLKYF